MTYKYIVIKEKPKFTTETDRITYGIKATYNDRIIKTVSDISSYFELVSRLAGLCNHLKLNPTQLEEVVEDMLNTSPKIE